MQNSTSHLTLMIIFLISPHYLAFNTGGGDGGREKTTSETSSYPSGGESGATCAPTWDYNRGRGSSPGGGRGYGSGSSRSPDGSGEGWVFGSSGIGEGGYGIGDNDGYGIRNDYHGNDGGSSGGREISLSESSSSPSRGSGVAHEPNWDYKWGWGSCPSKGWC